MWQACIDSGGGVPCSAAHKNIRQEKQQEQAEKKRKKAATSSNGHMKQRAI